MLFGHKKNINKMKMLLSTVKFMFYFSIIMSTMITFYYVDLYNKLSKQLNSIENRVKKLQEAEN